MTLTIDSLKAADYNPRRISPEQKAALQRSYERFGDLSGIIYNRKSGNLVGGHQRVSIFKTCKTKIETTSSRDKHGTVAIGHITAFTKNGPVRAPYREVNWPINLEMAGNVAANSGGGEFDQRKLSKVMTHLIKEKFDIEDVPLDMKGIIETFETSKGVKAKGDEKDWVNKDHNAMRYKAWTKLVQEWDDSIQNFGKKGTTSITKAMMQAKFIEAYISGGKIDRLATLAYTPHRVHVAGDQFPVSRIFKLALKNPKVMDSLIWMTGNGGGGNVSLDRVLASSLPLRGHRLPADFPIDLARDLINTYCPKGGRVLDPCHGWGGRSVGFLLSHAVAYVGFDVDPKTSAGVQEMFGDLNTILPKAKQGKFNLKPFEDSKLTPNSFDFALTSPPYFDTEKYEGAASSWKKYPTFEDWLKGFYFPFIKKAYDALKPGAYFALQVGNQRYPLITKAKEYAPKIGFKVGKVLATNMRNNQADTGIDKGEVILLLRKRR